MSMRRRASKTPRPPVPRLKWPRDFLTTKGRASGPDTVRPTPGPASPDPDRASQPDAERRPT